MYPHSYAISWLINYLTWIPVFPRTVASAITPPACSCGSLAILVKQTSKFNGMAQKEIQEHELLFEYIHFSSLLLVRKSAPKNKKIIIKLAHLIRDGARKWD